MSVFLRWGVFGILSVAALLYAYNASKRLAENRAGVAPAVASTEETEQEPAVPRSEAMPPHCEEELMVAQRALEARRNTEPLDRLLRIEEIAFQEGERRARLVKVATRWYEREGSEPGAEALRVYVATDCKSFSPAP